MATSKHPNKFPESTPAIKTMRTDQLTQDLLDAEKILTSKHRILLIGFAE